MDPLSIAASIAGLLALAGKGASTLVKVSSGIGDVSQSMNELISLTKEIEIVFATMNILVLSIGSVSRDRLSLIRVDSLVATLTEAVLTFRELEGLVNRFGMYPRITLSKRMTFIWKEDTIARIITRLERQKSSLSLILNIIQWFVHSSFQVAHMLRFPSSIITRYKAKSSTANLMWKRDSLSKSYWTYFSSY